MLYLHNTEVLNAYITLLVLLAQSDSEKRAAKRIAEYVAEGKVRFTMKGDSIEVYSSKDDTVYTASTSDCTCECGQSRQYAVKAMLAGKPGVKFNTCWHIMLKRLMDLLNSHSEMIGSDAKKAMMSKIKPTVLVIQ